MSKSISSQAIDQQHSRSEAGGSQSGPRAADPGNSELLPPSGAEARAEVGDPRRESSDPLKLSPRQVLALKCLANGVSITDAALSARVGRSTVHRWITEHPAFRAAYNRWKAAVQLSAQTRLIALQDLAVEVMSEELEEKRNGRLAALILTKMGALTASPSSATDPRRAGKEIETERQWPGCRARPQRHRRRYGLLQPPSLQTPPPRRPARRAGPRRGGGGGERQRMRCNEDEAIAQATPRGLARPRRAMVWLL